MSTGAPIMDASILRNRSRLLLVASLSLNALVAAGVVLHVIEHGGTPYVKYKLGLGERPLEARPFQVERQQLFKELPRTDFELVFAGDSHIAGTPFSEVYTPIRNRGIGGETTAGLLARLDEITARSPERIFLEIGANDVAQMVPVEETLRNYAEILRRLRSESPGTLIFILSVPPTCPEKHKHPTERNPTIRRLNEKLAALASAAGATFIDLTPVLAGPGGGMKPEFSAADGLHMNTRAQLEVCEVLRPYLPPQLCGTAGASPSGTAPGPSGTQQSDRVNAEPAVSGSAGR